MIHSWMEGLMWGLIFIATCIGGYFTGKLRLDGRIRDLLRAEKRALGESANANDIVKGELSMIQAVEAFLDGKKQ